MTSMGEKQKDKRYIRGDSWAGFWGASYEYYATKVMHVWINQLTDKNGGHSGHQGSGQYLDVRYASINGDVNEQVWTQNNNFDKATSQYMVYLFVKYGFNSVPGNVRKDPLQNNKNYYSILTQQGLTSQPALNNTRNFADHYHHIHLQNIDVHGVKVVQSLSIPSQSPNPNTGIDPSLIPDLTIPSDYFGGPPEKYK